MLMCMVTYKLTLAVTGNIECSGDLKKPRLVAFWTTEWDVFSERMRCLCFILAF